MEKNLKGMWKWAVVT